MMWPKTGATDMARAQAGPRSSIPWQEWLFRDRHVTHFRPRGVRLRAFMELLKQNISFLLGLGGCEFREERNTKR